MTKSIWLRAVFILIIGSVFVWLYFFGQGWQAQDVNSADKVLIRARNGLYQVDLITKQLTSYADPKDEILKFSGLPKIEETESVKTSAAIYLLSEDKSQAIVFVSKYDKTQPPNDFTGLLNLLERKYFICVVADKKCSPSTLIEDIASQLKYDNYYRINWYRWDSDRGLLFGNPSGEGIGNSSPVVIYDLKSKTYDKTLGYDCLKREKCAQVTITSVSPSLEKFIMIDGWKIILYKSSYPSIPFETFDISPSLGDASQGGIHALNWSSDEKTLVLGTDKNIYTFDLEKAKLDLIFSDTTVGLGLSYWERNTVRFSPSGRFIVFVDYGDSPTDHKNGADILKTIDLEKNSRVTEVLRQDYIGLSSKE